MTNIFKHEFMKEFFENSEDKPQEKQQDKIISAAGYQFNLDDDTPREHEAGNKLGIPLHKGDYPTLGTNAEYEGKSTSKVIPIGNTEFLRGESNMYIPQAPNKSWYTASIKFNKWAEEMSKEGNVEHQTIHAKDLKDAILEQIIDENKLYHVNSSESNKDYQSDKLVIAYNKKNDEYKVTYFGSLHEISANMNSINNLLE